MIAGLLNVLAIYDAWGGPVFTERKEEEDEEPSKKEPGPDGDQPPQDADLESRKS
jgi:hypothetical protein